MKSVFVDTNILVDLLADRAPFSKFAIEIFSKAENEKVKLYTSTHSIATAHYLLKKFIDEKELRKLLEDLLEFIIIISVDIDILKKALRSRHTDFEDAIQIVCANSISQMDYIVTRNTKDFKGSEIPVLAPDELVKRI
jgi:predicted nucleic acid-binding protein